MDTTVRLGPLKFSLQATIDHHGPSIHSGHYTASIYQLLQKNHSIATITQLRSLELLMTKIPLLHMLHCMNWLTHDFWTGTGGWEFDRAHGAGTSSPSHWQQIEEQAPKPVGWMMCFLLMTLVPVQKLCVNVYIYICLPYMSSVIGCIYIQRECHSVLAKLHPITFYRMVFLGSARFLGSLGWMALKTPTSATPVSPVMWSRSRFNTSGPDPLGFDWEDLAASQGTAGSHSGRPPIK